MALEHTTTRHLTEAQELDFKGLINEAFKVFRKAGYVARQRADAYDMTLAVKNDGSKIGWIGYDRQGAETIPHGTLYLSFEGTVQSDMGRALLVGRHAVRLLKTISGLAVEWDEKPEHSIKVIYLSEFERNKPPTAPATPTTANKDAKPMAAKTVKLSAAQDNIIEMMAKNIDSHYTTLAEIKRGTSAGNRDLTLLRSWGFISGDNYHFALLDAGRQYAIAHGWLAAPANVEPAQTDNKTFSDPLLQEIADASAKFKVGDSVIYGKSNNVETIIKVAQLNIHTRNTNGRDYQRDPRRLKHAVAIDTSPVIDKPASDEIASEDAYETCEYCGAHVEETTDGLCRNCRRNGIEPSLSNYGRWIAPVKADDADAALPTTDYRHEWNKRHIKAALEAEPRTVQQEIIVSMYNEISALKSANAAHEYIDAETTQYAPYFEKQIADELAAKDAEIARLQGERDAAAARISELETVLRANNRVLFDLHTRGAMNPNTVITMSDLYEMQVQMDENDGTLDGE